jgi:MtN3 and saliva related transmembrane protein
MIDGTDLVGWGASLVLLLTIGRQVYKQWQEGASPGISRWLFIGQFTASLGFVVYAHLLGNWVFVFTNSLMAVAAALGELMRRRPAAAARPDARQ